MTQLTSPLIEKSIRADERKKVLEEVRTKLCYWQHDEPCPNCKTLDELKGGKDK